MGRLALALYCLSASYVSGEQTQHSHQPDELPEHQGGRAGQRWSELKTQQEHSMDQGPSSSPHNPPEDSIQPSATSRQAGKVANPYQDPGYKAHIFLAAPCYNGMVTEGFATSLVNLSLTIQAMPLVDMSYKLLAGESLIPRARNSLLSVFLGSPEYTHLFFVDTDITFSPFNVLRLLEMSQKKHIVASPYPQKGLSFEQLKRHIHETVAANPRHQFTEEELRNVMTDFVFNLYSETGRPLKNRQVRVDNGFVRVDNAGTGFMMIRRDVLETMVDFHSDLKYYNDIAGYASPKTDAHFYALFDTMIDPLSRRYLSEDYAFCRRAQTLGFEVWMDMIADLHHTGTFTYDGDFTRNFDMDALLQATQQTT